MGALISAHQWGWGGSGGLSPAQGIGQSIGVWLGHNAHPSYSVSSHRNSSVPSLEQGKDHEIPETVSTLGSYLTACVIPSYITQFVCIPYLTLPLQVLQSLLKSG